jgi:hypothetical protein
MFQRQADLLAILSPQWSRRQMERHEEILFQHPFDDESDKRVRLTVSYRDKGYSPDVAWNMACERYPLPTSEPA